ncbi:uncharacterized protein LOC130735812 [Lotus japonicus]|uniref:uncharacterized protein LOC130735812 n=1 Tax=Lotus japonicus TaxID=34305 RepID=UPI002587E8D2|nr:uncharacterized protein LOC130735812 [Lotus japonicus]
MERDWAYLDTAALDLIVNKLEERIDHVWFGAVCKNWCSVAKLSHQNKQFRSNVLPMLLMPTKRNRRTKITKRSLYSIPGNRVYPFPLPMPCKKRFCGFSHGWLAMVSHTKHYHEYYHITLMNPFKNVAPIALPPLYNISGVNRVVLSVNPLTDPNDYVVAAIHGSCDRLSFIRAGKNYWTHVAVENNLCYADITFYQGLVYVVCGRKPRGWADWVDFDRIMSFNPYCSDDPYPRVKIIPNIFHQDNETAGFYSLRAYLVKSLEGDLWMVRRILPSQSKNCEDVDNVAFNLYKLELDAQNGKVLQMLKLEDLGDNILFVSDDSDSTAVSSSYFSNCLQKDSIYYTNDVGSPIPPSHDPLDLRVYNVKEGRFIQHYPFNNPSFMRVSPSLWILPSFQWD